MSPRHRGTDAGSDSRTQSRSEGAGPRGKDAPEPTLANVLEVLEGAYPLDWAEDWDRAGLVLGDRSATVRKILLAVDPTIAVADEAVEAGADLLITHHPLLMKGANFLPEDSGKGAVVGRLLRAGTALWCGHTNVDRSSLGTVGAWVSALSLRSVAPLRPADGREAEGDEGEDSRHGSRLIGLGATGMLRRSTTVRQLAERISTLVPATAQGIRFTGDPERKVRRVALCPGAGDSFLDLAAESGADVYITSDLRHHPALEHLESRADARAVPALIDVAHSASEALWLPLAKELLGAALPHLEVRTSEIPTDPWSGRVD